MLYQQKRIFASFIEEEGDILDDKIMLQLAHV